MEAESARMISDEGMRGRAILHIIMNLDVGGAETMLSRLLAHQQRAGMRLMVVSLLGKGVLGPKIEALGIPVIALRLNSVRGALILPLRLSSIIRQFHPDILHGWLIYGSLASTFISLFCRRRLPTIWGIRNSFSRRSKESVAQKIALFLGRSLSRYTSVLLFNSETGRKAYEKFGYFSARSRVIPNGFPSTFVVCDRLPTSLLGARVEGREAGPIIGLIARYHPMKDHRSFIEMAAQVSEYFPQAKFVLAGRDCDGENLSLVEQISQAGLGGRFLLLGELQSSYSLLQRLDLHVLSSAWGEGFPNIIGEALLSRNLCVATDVGDSSILIKDWGRVVPPGDSGALAAAVVELLSLSPEQQEQSRVEGEQFVRKNFDLTEISDRYLDLYRELLSRSV